MMTKQEMVKLLRDGLDDLCVNNASEPEWHKINGIRFMENYRIMRSIENDMDDEK